MIDEVDQLIVDAGRLWLAAADQRRLVERFSEVCHSLPWPAFLDTVARMRIAGTVWWNLRGAAYEMDPHARQYLESLFLYHRQRNAVLRDEISAIAAAFADDNVPVAFRKGAFLAFHRYPDTGMRVMNDIDVLVDPDHAKRAAETLRRLGYGTGRLDAADRVLTPESRARTAFFHLHTNNLPPMKRPTGSPYATHIRVDPVINLFLPGSGYSVNVADLLARAVTVPLGGVPAPVLAPEDFLLDLCAHTFKDCTTIRSLHRGGHRRIAQHCDIQALVGYPGTSFDWAVFVATSIRYDVAAPCYFTLAHTAALFPGVVPDPVITELAEAAGRGPDFLDEYGHVDLPEPRRWEQDIRTRLFSGRLPGDLPSSRSLV
ncbi:nucleotidyltransferase domain-containing protein [Actinoplanes utahensis]|uniref:Nucleotidyltransferase family protein n=1 Tax=Actinoplanes utahensis TaxID=1869 RepID=A0A0A6UCR8_ACTUT|nr:nucleotidyltransferase family protein [Actinoplanes utahensis]KHD72089.1 hypothetical protein MB27_42375 [Actinoplanes utahensis]GIF28836.1 hypothetical protein Aut01nite_18220 [Actinoplanes utahensis]